MTQAGLLPDVVHTSLLRRAITTADLALDAADRHWIDVHRSWRLNERQLRPPPVVQGGPPGQDADARYRGLGVRVPSAESLKDVLDRLLPYWESAIVPDLRANRTVLVVAHGNALRALVKLIDGVSDDAIVGMHIPNGVPLRYDLTDALHPIVRGGSYLSSH
jgi:2,3-bisphosphoglycerate-dependent phosphoglycerate mutase